MVARPEWLIELGDIADGVAPRDAVGLLPRLDMELSEAAAANGRPLEGWRPAAADYARQLLGFLLERRSKGLPAWPAWPVIGEEEQHGR